MANIMINEICNLHCPYCFADEYVNKKFNEISMSDFDKALAFAISGGVGERIGIIGGEPTLHSHFSHIMVSLIGNKDVHSVTVFTNGTNIEKFVDELCHPKIHLLINCNSIHDMGEKNYNKMLANIDLFIRRKYMKDRITLGINMYKPDFDFLYIVDLLKKYGFNTVRTSISVPNNTEYKSNPLDYFMKMKARVLEFYAILADNNIAPFFDCNNMPECIWSEEERNKSLSLYPGADRFTNIFDTTVRCSPVIDILPDLSIIRCFGLSQYTKKPISEFKNIQDARNYYRNTIDSYAGNITHSEKCKTCYNHVIGKCTGGCLCFTIDKVIRARDYVEMKDAEY